MDKPSYITKSFTITGVDGNHIKVSETADRQEVVLSIQQNDEAGHNATVRLSGPQFDMLCETKYSLEVARATSPSEASGQ